MDWRGAIDGFSTGCQVFSMKSLSISPSRTHTAARPHSAPVSSTQVHSVPRHLAIVQDYSPASGSPQNFTRALSASIDLALGCGVRHLSLLVCSADDARKTSRAEAPLIAHLDEFLRQSMPGHAAKGVRFGVLGQADGFSEPLFETLRQAPLPENGERLLLTLAVNYDGRGELAQAVKAAALDVAAGVLRAEDLTRDALHARLASSHLPPVDLLVRTARGAALSHFLLWQTAYAELYFTPVPFVSFESRDLSATLDDYALRRRTFGGL
jgi:undecaprenyl diphosphate synthase